MKKTNLYWLGGMMFFVAAILVSAFTIAVKHEPNFYRQSQVPPSDTRKKLANQFLNKFAQMVLYIRDRQETWGCEASEAEINCFFQELFVQRGEAETLRELGISAPSITLEGDEVRMAFRYGKGWFSTVISYELKVWLVTKEANVIAVQILSARAGAVPISCQSILHQLSDFATKQNYKVTLYRHDSTPVAIISLQPDQPNPISTLTMLEFAGNKLTIGGKTLEHAVPPPTITVTNSSPPATILTP